MTDGDPDHDVDRSCVAKNDVRVYTSLCKHLRSADGRPIFPRLFFLSSLTLRDPDRGHFDPHGGVCDLRLSSRGVSLFLEEQREDPGLIPGTVRKGDDGRRLLLLLLLTPVVGSSWIRGDEMRKEEATSARRCQEQAGQRTRSWPSSRFRPPPSHLRRAFSPAARSESIRFFFFPRECIGNTIFSLPSSTCGRSPSRHLSPGHLFVNCQCRSSCSSSVALLRDCTVSANI